MVIKQLKRCCLLALGGGGRALAAADPPQSPGSSPEEAGATTAAGAELKALLNALLKHLDLDQLETLSHAVQTRGLEKTACVRLDGRDVAFGEASADVQRLCCMAWRWPDLSDATALKRLPCCAAPDGSAAAAATTRCINPYHWSRVLCAGPPSSDDDYLRCNGGCVNSPPPSCAWTPGGGRRAAETSTVSTATDGYSRSSWCQLAYWELRRRVGPLFPVYDETVDVFHDMPEHGGSGGLSLQALQQQQMVKDADQADAGSAGSRERVRRVRSKIGLGITLHRERSGGSDDGVGGSAAAAEGAKRRCGSSSSRGVVWLYNRSDVPVFVSSCLLGVGGDGSGPLLSPGRRSSWRVHKLPPGYCAQVYESDCVESAASAFRRDVTDLVGAGGGCRGGLGEDGPVDFHSIHVSFAKGWGPGYSRQSVTSCACWLEILVDAAKR